MDEQKAAKLLLDEVRLGHIAPINLSSTIDEIGGTGIAEARSDLEHFLHHSDPNVRRIALKVLCFYYNSSTDYRPAAIDFLLNDPFPSCRGQGASMLGELKKNTRDAQTLVILALVVRNPEEYELVRKYAYRAMRSIFHYDSQEQLDLIDSEDTLDQIVDWSFVDSYLPIENGKRLLSALSKGQIAPQDLSATLSEIAKSGVPDAYHEIKRYLSSDEPDVRAMALKILCLYYNQKDDYFPLALHFLLHDPSTLCRAQGATMIGVLKSETKDQQTLETLAQVVQNTQEDLFVRKAAYLALYRVIFYDYDMQQKIHLQDFSLAKDVDWNLVNRYTV